jgi:hypothetical protein
MRDDRILCVESHTPQAVELTFLRNAWSDGYTATLARLTPIVYAELAGYLLQPSALVNEALLRLMGGAPV